jgi:hypothetical protein
VEERGLEVAIGVGGWGRKVERKGKEEEEEKKKKKRSWRKEKKGKEKKMKMKMMKWSYSNNLVFCVKTEVSEMDKQNRTSPDTHPSIRIDQLLIQHHHPSPCPSSLPFLFSLFNSGVLEADVEQPEDVAAARGMLHCLGEIFLKKEKEEMIRRRRRIIRG